MSHSSMLEAGVEPDLIEEIKLRTWARQHYAPENARSTDWHPVVLDEMRQKDREQQA